MFMQLFQHLCRSCVGELIVAFPHRLQLSALPPSRLLRSLEGSHPHSITKRTQSFKFFMGTQPEEVDRVSSPSRPKNHPDNLNLTGCLAAQLSLLRLGSLRATFFTCRPLLSSNLLLRFHQTLSGPKTATRSHRTACEIYPCNVAYSPCESLVIRWPGSPLLDQPSALSLLESKSAKA